MIIKIRDLYRTFNKNSNNEQKVLRGINLDINKGKSISIMGVSGSGKTTLLNIIGLIDKKYYGSYYYYDEKNNNEINIGSLNDIQLAKMRNSVFGYILQEYGLLVNNNVYDNVYLPLCFSSKFKKHSDRKKRVYEVLEKVGLSKKAKSKVKNLSGGEKQRVAIARALVNNPSIILADEPTGALDSDTKLQIMDILKLLNKEGCTVIMVTHDIEVASYFDDIYYMKNGILTSDNK